MAGRAELDARIARLEAALDAAEAALAAPRPDPEAEAALGEARQRIATLEAALERAERSRPAPGQPAPGQPADEGGEVARLRAEVAELRTAREMDLAEMKSLLAELEPLLEGADA